MAFNNGYLKKEFKRNLLLLNSSKNNTLHIMYLGGIGLQNQNYNLNKLSYL